MLLNQVKEGGNGSTGEGRLGPGRKKVRSIKEGPL
jgi:hypothetical protein